jgi:hypothetical protein
MSEAKAHYPGPPDAARDAGSSGPRPSAPSYEPATHRAPAAAAAAVPRPGRASAYPTMPPPPPSTEPQTSWWRALLSVTLSPPALPSGIAPRQGRSLAQHLAVRCVAVAMALPLAALVACLWTVPAGSPPSVAMTVVIGRVAFAVALLVFCVALLRSSERFLSAAGGDSSDGG